MDTPSLHLLPMVGAGKKKVRYVPLPPTPRAEPPVPTPSEAELAREEAMQHSARYFRNAYDPRAVELQWKEDAGRLAHEREKHGVGRGAGAWAGAVKNFEVIIDEAAGFRFVLPPAHDGAAGGGSRAQKK